MQHAALPQTVQVPPAVQLPQAVPLPPAVPLDVIPQQEVEDEYLVESNSVQGDEIHENELADIPMQADHEEMEVQDELSDSSVRTNFNIKKY